MSFVLPNPYVMLGAVVAAAAIGLYAFHEGDAVGAARVQTKFDAYQKEVSDQATKKQDEVDKATQALQSQMDQQRKDDAKALADLSTRTAATIASLQRRASRPAVASAGNPAAGPGPQGGSTGAGLYRDDGLFLVGKADLWQRIRLQRDACYASYEAAQKVVDDLNAKLAATK